MSSLHPGEWQVLRAVRRSPADPRTWPVRFHLLWCKSCRVQAREADAELISLFNAHVPPIGDFTNGYEQSLARLLSGMRELDEARDVKIRSSRRRRRRVVLAGAGMLAACVGIVMLVSFPNRNPKWTAPKVLADAAAHEQRSSVDVQPGVVFQRLQVKGGGGQFEWLVYRDREGKRKPHFQTAWVRETALSQRLAEAGITREDPLSVSSYSKWRNRLGSHNDSVVISPSGLIAVKTSAAADPESSVREETLLLRGFDYHPVSRSVTFRDAESVEIAELDYRVLDWKQVQKGWFEELAPASIPVRRIAHHDLPSIRTVKLDAAELNLAELKARLILSTSNADTNEQIDVVRAEDGIRVEGLASSLQRKHELETALEAIPYVSAKLTTPEERAAGESARGTPTRLKLVESVSQASPLLLYLRNRPGQADSYPQFSARMMDSALRITQQCHAFGELEAEFGPGMPLDTASRHAYGDLIGDHVAKLEKALADQTTVLHNLSHDGLPRAHRAATASAADMAKHASKSLALSKELISGEGTAQRDAVLILNDLAQENSTLIGSLDALRTASSSK